jgi:anthranilate synthase component 2
MEAEGVLVDIQLNDSFDLSQLSIYDKVVLSPGPGLPKDSGALMEVIANCEGVRPVLGVCLGMQGVAEFFGGDLYNQEVVKHGVSETIQVEDSILFKELPQKIEVGLYHSWAVTTNGDYKVTARSENGTVMALENVEKQMYGVQFHPESIMTPEGKVILQNFLNL